MVHKAPIQWFMFIIDALGGVKADTPPADYRYKAELALCPERQHFFLSVKKQWLCGLQRLS